MDDADRARLDAHFDGDLEAIQNYLAWKSTQPEAHQMRFLHDSTCCVFTGSGTIPDDPRFVDREYDFYFCPATGSVIARYGDDGPDYTSFGSLGYPPKLMALDPRLAEAYRRAVERGHIRADQEGRSATSMPHAASSSGDASRT
jgi:hypothetical protein